MRSGLIVILLVFIWGCSTKNGRIDLPPVGIGSEEPSLIETDYGLILSWMEPVAGDIQLRMSIYNGLNWSEPKVVAKGYNWFINWADFPAIAANGDLLFAHYLEISGEKTYDYDVMYTTSIDRGTTWQKPAKLHMDSVSAEHGFVSAVAYEDGFLVSWLDGRYTKLDSGAMSIRVATIDSMGKVADDFEIDNKTCDCCQTALTVTNGQPIVFYRDRSDEEVRDISFAKYSATKWQQPESLHSDNWVINGCPVNGPAVASEGNNLALAWFTGAEGNAKIKLKISADGGNSFALPIELSNADLLGRVDVQLKDDLVYLTYMSLNSGNPKLLLSIYSLEGNLMSTTNLVSLSSDRGTGFPRTAIWKDQLIVSWTDVDEKKVKLLHYPLEKNSIGTHLTGF